MRFATKEDIKSNAVTRLGTMLETIDDIVVDYLADEVIETVKANLNWPEVPYDLKNTVGGMVAGRYLLQAMTTTSSAKKAGIDVEAPVSSMTEGDISVSFSTEGSDTANIRALANEWANPAMSVFVRYRRLR